MTHSHPSSLSCSQSYSQLVRRQQEHRLASTDNPRPFAVCLEDSKILCGGELGARLKGVILLNLGSGCRQELLDPVEAFARQYGVSKVIHVDYRKTRESDHSTRGIVVTHVQKDMLAFLAHQPSRSMSVTLNGIDDCVIEEEAYARAVGEEISRVVPSGGLAFGYVAWPLRFIKGFTPVYEMSGKEGMPSGYYLKTTVTGKTGVVPSKPALAETGLSSSQTPPRQQAF